LVCADDVNILDESVGIIKKNTGALVVASKENGLEVNVDKSKYMVMSGDQNAGRSHNNIQVNTDNSSFERVDSSSIWEQLKIQNSIQEETASRLNSENACYHSIFRFSIFYPKI